MSKYTDLAMERRKQFTPEGKPAWNCCQSVVSVFAGDAGYDETAATKAATYFRGGMQMGSVCGAITGAVMALDLIAGGDATGDPAGAKRRAAGRSRELQKRFSERFGALRCRELLKNEKEEPSDAVRALGIADHCGVMIASAVEIAEELLREEGL